LALGTVELIDGDYTREKFLYNLCPMENEFEKEDDRLKVSSYELLTDDNKVLEKILDEEELLIRLSLVDHTDEIISRLREKFTV
jgi:hypothetical protein